MPSSKILLVFIPIFLVLISCGGDGSTNSASNWEPTSTVFSSDPAENGNLVDLDIATDGNGNIITVWSELFFGYAPNRISSNYYNTATGWGGINNIKTSSNGGAGRSRADMNSNGDAIAVWIEHDGTNSSVWANYFDAASGWGTAQLVEQENIGSYFAPVIAVDDGGDATILYEQFEVGVGTNVWTSRYNSVSGWSTGEPVESYSDGSAYGYQIANDHMGNAIAVWHQGDGTSQSIWARRFDSVTGWEPEIEIENVPGWAMAPQIEFDNNGNAIVVWFNMGGLNRIMANTYDNIEGWGTAVQIAAMNDFDKPWPHSDIDIDSNGNAIVVWEEIDGSDGSVLNAWANYYDKDNGWGPAEMLESNPDSLTYPHVAFDSNDNAIVIWVRKSEDATADLWAKYYNKVSGWKGAELIYDNHASSLDNPHIVFDGLGQYVVMWNDDSSIYEKRYKIQ